MNAPLICPHCGHEIKTLQMYGGVAGQTEHCTKCHKQLKYSYKHGDNQPTVIKL